MALDEQMFQSIFPDVPREAPAIDKGNHFTALWDLYFGALSQALQANFKSEGIVFPPLTADQMSRIQALYASYVGGTYNALTAALPDISGQTVFDSTTYTSNQFVIATDNNTIPNVLLAQWVPFSMMLTYAGSPTGNVAGVLNWLCYDTTDKVLYICTATGSMSSATWQLV
jgi:hypothetical protein